MYLPQSYYDAISGFRVGMEAIANESLKDFVDYLSRVLPLVRDMQVTNLVNLVINDLLDAQKKSDYLYVADVLEYELLATGIANVIPITDLDLVTVPQSPQVVGASIELSGIVNQGNAPEKFEYDYLFRSPFESIPRTVNSWQTDPNYIWNTNNLGSGEYLIVLRIRQKGSDLDYQAKIEVNFELLAQ